MTRGALLLFAACLSGFACSDPPGRDGGLGQGETDGGLQADAGDRDEGFVAVRDGVTVGGRCVSPIPSAHEGGCRSDVDCDGDELGGVCFRRDEIDECQGSCTSNEECGDGYVCPTWSGALGCVTSCRTSADCPCGRRCAPSGECVRDPCLSNEECPRHMECGEPLMAGGDDSGCRLISCSVDDGCPADTVCVRGYCAEQLGYCADGKCS